MGPLIDEEAVQNTRIPPQSTFLPRGPRWRTPHLWRWPLRRAHHHPGPARMGHCVKKLAPILYIMPQDLDEVIAQNNSGASGAVERTAQGLVQS